MKDFLSLKIYNKGNIDFLVNYFSKLEIYKIATLILGNSFFEKHCAFVFGKIVLFRIRQTSFLKKSLIFYGSFPDFYENA